MPGLRLVNDTEILAVLGLFLVLVVLWQFSDLSAVLTLAAISDLSLTALASRRARRAARARGPWAGMGR